MDKFTANGELLMDNENIFSLITTYFWIIAIALSFVNAVVVKQRLTKYITENPEREQGYSDLIKGFLIYGNIPWIVMGIGVVAGKVDSLFCFFRPQDGNPYVIAFIASLILVWILGTIWLFFRDGANMIIKHPGFLNIDISNPTFIKLFWLLILVIGILCIFMMIRLDVQV
ncbi:MAG TPA: hypothetical protein PLN69_08860 [bacterium]|nr:hypothetical protein [bacterium]